MIRNLRLAVLNLLLLLPVAGPWAARAEGGPESDPAFLPIDQAIDLKAIPPEVNINLPRFLLKDAVAGLSGGTNDPLAGTGINLAELVRDVKLIRVVVIDGKAAQQPALAKGVGKLRDLLETKWTPIVSVPGDNVGIYALGDAKGETLAGLALLIHDGGDAVIVNIVGNVSLGKIVQIASRFDKLPKDLLKKLSAAGEGKTAKAEAEPAPAKPAQ